MSGEFIRLQRADASAALGETLFIAVFFILVFYSLATACLCGIESCLCGMESCLCGMESCLCGMEACLCRKNVYLYVKRISLLNEACFF